jgi:hypothetical protein
MRPCLTVAGQLSRRRRSRFASRRRRSRRPAPSPSGTGGTMDRRSCKNSNSWVILNVAPSGATLIGSYELAEHVRVVQQALVLLGDYVCRGRSSNPAGEPRPVLSIGGTLPGNSPATAPRVWSGRQQRAPMSSRQPKSVPSATCMMRQPMKRRAILVVVIDVEPVELVVVGEVAVRIPVTERDRPPGSSRPACSGTRPRCGGRSPDCRQLPSTKLSSSPLVM